MDIKVIKDISDTEQALLETPEFRELEGVVENNIWHHNETVHVHTLTVLRNLKEILRSLDRGLIKKLRDKIGNRKREELLIVATLLHDISKKETINTDLDGVTRCPGHEEAGAEKAVGILKRFGFSKTELSHVAAIIKSHALTDAIFTPDNQISKGEHEKLRARFIGDIYLELILLTFADAMSEYTKTSRPEEYKLKMDFYKRELGSLGQK